MKYAIGLDIGGTKVAAGIISEEGELIHRTEVKSDVTGSDQMYDSVKQALHSLMEDSTIQWDQIEGMGAGIPGKVDIENGIAVFQNNIPWPNFPVAEKLRQDFPIQRVVLDNDVYMAAFSEWKKAEMKTEELFTFVTISTGISSSSIQNGKFLRGAGFAGEVGQVAITSPFTQEHVTLEQAVAGPGIEKASQKIYQDDQITTKGVFEKYQQQDPIAIEIIDKAAATLAEGVHMIVTLLDPHHITFGGSISTYNPFFIDLMKEKMNKWLLPDQRHILSSISISHYENLSGLVGAGLRVFHAMNEE
ncbi:ROK family protein [Jeotgalibaca sp. MA1X17-3]|uniref:ROK family protein n=1 Tax=Jeotgalibaca sp. MA1X17-3 TaxID=2908211 RepID=UPI001F22BDE2|nr:ROK family protein [Jeotgalibaca sp. MA1X17-3]UJF15347.1 ROK family protein [Jeotgalibaca sp. MA1X17-3]